MDRLDIAMHDARVAGGAERRCRPADPIDDGLAVQRLGRRLQQLSQCFALNL